MYSNLILHALEADDLEIHHENISLKKKEPFLRL